jgi:hypothetical protein
MNKRLAKAPTRSYAQKRWESPFSGGANDGRASVPDGRVAGRPV